MSLIAFFFIPLFKEALFDLFVIRLFHLFGLGFLFCFFSLFFLICNSLSGNFNIAKANVCRVGFVYYILFRDIGVVFHFIVLIDLRLILF